MFLASKKYKKIRFFYKKKYKKTQKIDKKIDKNDEKKHIISTKKNMKKI